MRSLDHDGSGDVSPGGSGPRRSSLASSNRAHLRAQAGCGDVRCGVFAGHGTHVAPLAPVICNGGVGFRGNLREGQRPRSRPPGKSFAGADTELTARDKLRAENYSAPRNRLGANSHASGVTQPSHGAQGGGRSLCALQAARGRRRRDHIGHCYGSGDRLPRQR